MTVDETIRNIERQKQIFSFEDKFNPQHYYCRLLDIGLNRRVARKFAERYELEIYKPLLDYVKRGYQD